MKKIVLSLLCCLLLTSCTGCGRQQLPETSLPSISTFGAQEEGSDIPSEAVDPEPKPDARLRPAMQQNKDTVAWLTIPGTSIDGPVQQSVDNEYYLRRDEWGQHSFEGCYFADYECSIADAAGLSTNTIIYGHTFQEDAEQKYFAQLHRYIQDADFARENRSIYFSTTDRMLEWEVISVGTVDAETDSAVIQANPNAAELEALLTAARYRDECSYGYTVKAEEKILTLSTCTGDNDTRLVLVAVLTG